MGRTACLIYISSNNLATRVSTTTLRRMAFENFFATKLNNKMEHVMIDLETLDTSNNAVFLSVAAVQFDLEDGAMGEHFKINISLTSAVKAGLTIGADTLQWWLQQRPEVMRLMFEDPCELYAALNRLALFFKTTKVIYVWGNSARFDLGILENAYRKLNITPPWNSRNERCYRTVVGLFPPDFFPDSTGQEHDPIYDCQKQIKVLTGIQKKYFKVLYP